ncbi:hypothetical protein LTR06_011418 [Exophiala xenobiotica]|nr:hypothetical protein LTR06_011418 [Exophiala xenobiotica]
MPTTTVGQNYTEGPKAPANRFFPVCRSTTTCSRRRVISSSRAASSSERKRPISSADPHHPVSQHFGYYCSPRPNPPPAFHSSSLTNTSSTNHDDHPSATSPQAYDPPNQSYPSPQFGRSAPSNGPPAHEAVQFGAGAKSDLQRPSYARAEDDHLSDPVKRHLHVFAAELRFNEISEASARTLDFARSWAQHFHHGSRWGYFHEALPSLSEMDEVLRHSRHIFESLAHLREFVIAQQTASSEHCARQADEYPGQTDRYGNRSLVDRRRRNPIKRRRGEGTTAEPEEELANLPSQRKAAPLGRCHSCNRADTPEWRRGPDGALQQDGGSDEVESTTETTRSNMTLIALAMKTKDIFHGPTLPVRGHIIHVPAKIKSSVSMDDLTTAVANSASAPGSNAATSSPSFGVTILGYLERDGGIFDPADKIIGVVDISGKVLYQDWKPIQTQYPEGRLAVLDTPRIISGSQVRAGMSSAPIDGWDNQFWQLHRNHSGDCGRGPTLSRVVHGPPNSAASRTYDWCI